MTFSPNRVVAFLTPLLFAPLVDAISAATAKYGLAALWTKGWPEYEKREEGRRLEAPALAADPDRRAVPTASPTYISV